MLHKPDDSTPSLHDCFLVVHEPNQEICIGLLLNIKNIYIASFVICRATRSCSEETMEWCRKDSSQKTPGKLFGTAKSSWQKRLSAGYSGWESPVSEVMEKCKKLRLQQHCDFKSQICYKEIVLNERDAGSGFGASVFLNCFWSLFLTWFQHFHFIHHLHSMFCGQSDLLFFIIVLQNTKA